MYKVRDDQQQERCSLLVREKQNLRGDGHRMELKEAIERRVIDCGEDERNEKGEWFELRAVGEI